MEVDRIAELLAANNVQVERRRTAENKVFELQWLIDTQSKLIDQLRTALQDSQTKLVRVEDALHRVTFREDMGW